MDCSFVSGLSCLSIEEQCESECQWLQDVRDPDKRQQEKDYVPLTPSIRRALGEDDTVK